MVVRAIDLSPFNAASCLSCDLTQSYEDIIEDLVRECNSYLERKSSIVIYYGTIIDDLMEISELLWNSWFRSDDEFLGKLCDGSFKLFYKVRVG